MMNSSIKLFAILAGTFLLSSCSSMEQQSASAQKTDARPATTSKASGQQKTQGQNSVQQLPVDTSASGIGALVIKDLLTREYMMYITDDFTGLHYAEAAAGYGALKFVATISDHQTLSSLEDRYRKPPATGQLLTAGHVDANVYGILPLELYKNNRDGRKLYEGLELADAQWVSTRPDGLTSQSRFWIDDIWMVNLLQLQAYRVTDNPVYLDRAALQTEMYLRELQRDNGLFYHGKDAPFYWGRGNGWVAAGMAELLQNLTPQHPRYSFIVARYRKMMEALLLNQAHSGMWRQLIDKPESWQESSATAMFGYAMSVGVSRGLLSSYRYRPAVERAWQGLLNHVTTEGLLTEVCVGTGQSKDINYYLQRPRVSGDLHGQAPLLWFATEMVTFGF